MNKKWLTERLVGAFIILIIILLVALITQMSNQEAVLNEGIAKSIPLLKMR